MLDKIKTKLSNAWGTFWAWFYNSGTIVWNWLVKVFGAAIVTIGAMDFSSLIAMERKQAYAIGGALILQGILQNMIRLSGTKVVENHLVPTAEAMKAEEVKVEVVPVAESSKKAKSK